jgi:hypothetical protein
MAGCGEFTFSFTLTPEIFALHQMVQFTRKLCNDHNIPKGAELVDKQVAFLNLSHSELIIKCLDMMTPKQRNEAGEARSVITYSIKRGSIDGQ